MAITDALVLPADVLIVPVQELHPQVRDQFECEDGDFAITRPRARTPSRIIDAQAAELLQEFRTPRTIAEAVIRFSQTRQADPEQTLVDAYPMLQGLVHSEMLVPADSERAREIVATLEPGEKVQDFEVVHCIQVLEDTELYRVRAGAGQEAAMKILRPGSRTELQRVYQREAAILKKLDGIACPRLIVDGKFGERPFLIIEWCPGVDAAAAAQELRHRPGGSGRNALLGLCRSILDAYVLLHERGVVHADVHARNVLVDADGTVRIIDFGLARMEDSPGGQPHRGGVGFFFEPEYAKARQRGRRPPAASAAGEQYALAVLLYYLISGVYYVDFSLEKKEMYRQIAEDRPLPFARRGIRPWTEVESVLERALSKEPKDRFPSVAEFAARLGAVSSAAEPDAGIPAREAGSSNRPPAEELLNAVLQRVAAGGPLLEKGLESAPICSVNNGAAGIAYALYRIACLREDSNLLALADIWATRAARDVTSEHAFFSKELEMTPEIVGPVSVYHTASGVHCVQALIAQAMGDVVAEQMGVDGFLAMSGSPCENLDLTLGRSGTLLACSLLLDAIPDDPLVNLQPLREFGEALRRNLWQELDAQPPIRNVPKLSYLGIAHGWAGVVYATIRWCQSTGQSPPASVAERLGQLAELAEPAGQGVRWKRRLRKKSREQTYDYVPSWCNGSAGFVHLWTLSHDVFHEPDHLELARKAAWNAFEDSNFLGDLCCGLSGRAYALLNLYKHTGERVWLDRAREFADKAAGTIGSTTIRDHSLYKGSVGVAVLAADLARPEASCMPLFESEGWPKR